MGTIILTKPDFIKLRKRYELAVKNKEEDFTFQGHEFYTKYAKYFLEYYEPKVLR
jgi:hypothetical protein